MLKGPNTHWRKLQKKGRYWSVACSLCLQDDETTQHLLIHCKYTQLIWKEILNSLNITDAWNHTTLEGNLLQWFTNYPKMRFIPFLVCWRIWKYRNKILFENWHREDLRIITKILLDIQEHKGTKEVNKVEYILSPIYFDDKPIGFFDGVVVNDHCGAGIYIKLNSEHSFKALFAGGKGNNMKAEILGLWGLLFLAHKLSICRLMVAGDSKVTIDWINESSKLNLLYLHNWKEQIKRLKEGFEDIKFMHIHREFNTVADHLSKKAMDNALGWYHFEEIHNGTVVNKDSIKIF
jgi:ribonuclease HI